MYLIVTVFIISFVSCGLIRPILAWLGVVDVPNQRSSHANVTIRGGGLAIIITIMGAIYIENTNIKNIYNLRIILTLGFLAGVSFLDDIFSIGSGKRLIVHFVTACLGMTVFGLTNFTLYLTRLESLAIPGILSFLIAILWIVGYINAFNFMDGINGLASLQCIVTSWTSCLLAYNSGISMDHWAFSLSLIVGAACLGFLPYNFPKAKMFLGDVGSAPLGMLLAFIVLGLGQASEWRLLVPLIILHANFILDTAFTLARRIAQREKWYTAHRSHYYQKLQRSGKSHLFVTNLEMVLQFIVVFIAWCCTFSTGGSTLLLVCGVLLLWFGFFFYCERQFRLYGIHTR